MNKYRIMKINSKDLNQFEIQNGIPNVTEYDLN